PSVPSGTSSSSTVPSSTASTSMVALSVSISAITSPDFTASPFFTCHLASVPSSMVGDRAASGCRSCAIQEEVRAGLDDGVRVQSVVTVEIREIAHLPEAVRPEAGDPLAQDAAEP